MILDSIVLDRKNNYEEIVKDKSINEIIKETENRIIKDKDFFYKALKKDKITFICEVKKASPSKGIIKKDFNYLEIAKEYEKYGASAISCLTEPKYFQGSDKYLTEIKQNVNIPVLRKDFIFSEYQIYESKAIGADAILLICSILDDKSLNQYIDLAHKIGLGVLVEAHDEEELNRALKTNAIAIGVNNRNLKNFIVDFNTSIKLRNLVDKDIIFVSESGIYKREHIKELENNKVNAVLIGEALMTSSNIKSKIEELMYD